jgi:hypothetical protein
LQDRIAISRVAPLAAVHPEGDLRTVLDPVAEGFEPAERRLLGIGLGEPPAHRSALGQRDENELSLTWRQCASDLFMGV